MKLLIITNIPSPYRLDFFNELGKYIDLTVLFEAERNFSLNELWYTDNMKYFNAVFLKKGAIEEQKINLKIIKFLRNNKFDKILLTNYSYYTELAALLYLKVKRKKYFMELDGSDIKNENFLIRNIKRFVINGADLYFSPSVQTDVFLENYGVEQKKIIRYPFTSLQSNDILKTVPTEEEKNQLKKELDISYKKIVISVGQFIYRKGYDILLKASVLLPSDTGLYIIGGKPTNEYTAIKANYNLHNVHFIDFKEKKELKKYYMMSDVFVLPTRKDIWGLVINEAMANGLPIITTDKCTAGIELVKNGENGFIVPTNNAQKLSEAMLTILNDKIMCQNMGQKSLELINDYTIENMVKKHLEILL